MTPSDPMEAAFSRPITWPMEPTRILLSLGKLTPDLYLCIFQAHKDYEKACSDAKDAMYGTILRCMREKLM